MLRYHEIDIAVSASGDLVVQSNADLSLTSGSGVLKQDISFRLRTNPGEFVPHLDFGAGLDNIIGEPNDRETCKAGEAKIIRSLVQDGMVANGDLYTRGVPISTDAIMYYVFVNNGQGQWNVTPDVVFNMMNGLTNLPGA
jgi:hypothetical protein